MSHLQEDTAATKRDQKSSKKHGASSKSFTSLKYKLMCQNCDASD
jgi:hypothetical protein